MSYKLMSKVPGDRHSELQQVPINERKEPQDDEPNALISKPQAPSLQYVNNSDSS